MIARPRRRQLTGMALFAGLSLLTLFARLLPLAPGRIPWPGPDLLLCFAVAWVLRRPREAPAPLIAALALAEDLLLLRPPGLWAAILLLGTEAARAREARWREQPFVVEWLRVAGLTALMLAAYRAAMVLALVEVPPLGTAVLQALATVAAYPAAALLVGLARGRWRGAIEAEG